MNALRPDHTKYDEQRHADEDAEIKRQLELLRHRQLENATLKREHGCAVILAC